MFVLISSTTNQLLSIDFLKKCVENEIHLCGGGGSAIHLWVQIFAIVVDPEIL